LESTFSLEVELLKAKWGTQKNISEESAMPILAK
jgi:hypothetical protein